MQLLSLKICFQFLICNALFLLTEMLEAVVRVDLASREQMTKKRKNSFGMSILCDTPLSKGVLEGGLAPLEFKVQMKEPTRQ